MSVWKKYGFAWVTIGFLLFSLLGHWIFGWFAFVGEHQDQSLPVEVGSYVTVMLRDTFENWQSEFVQLLWQVAGLTLLLYVGSPQSKESEDRAEAMIKAILKRVDPDGATRTLAEIEKKYPSK